MSFAELQESIVGHIDDKAMVVVKGRNGTTTIDRQQFEMVWVNSFTPLNPPTVYDATTLAKLHSVAAKLGLVTIASDLRRFMFAIGGDKVSFEYQDGSIWTPPGEW